MLSSYYCAFIELDRRSAFALAIDPLDVDSGKPPLLLYRVYYGARRPLSGFLAHEHPHLFAHLDSNAYFNAYCYPHLNLIANSYATDTYRLTQPYSNDDLDAHIKPNLYLHLHSERYAHSDCISIFYILTHTFTIRDSLSFPNSHAY